MKRTSRPSPEGAAPQERAPAQGPGAVDPEAAMALDPDAQQTYGNAFLQQLAGMPTTDDGRGRRGSSPRSGPGSGDAATPAASGPSGVSLGMLMPRTAGEWLALMSAEPRSEGRSPFAGMQIVERLGPPRALAGMLGNADLVGGQGRPATAAEVIGRTVTGNPGTFTIDAQGNFTDFHGGPGFNEPGWVEWFTPAALQRGVGWYFEQTYTHEGRAIARFRVERILDATRGLTVNKTPIG